MMTIASRTRSGKFAAAGLAGMIMFPAAAIALNLPLNGPVPTPRPAVEAQNGLRIAPERTVVQISTRIQEMPEERRHVRVVGPKFLPDAGAEIDFAAVSGQQAAAVDYAEWLVMTAITRIFEADGAEKDLHLASN